MVGMEASADRKQTTRPRLKANRSRRITKPPLGLPGGMTRKVHVHKQIHSLRILALILGLSVATACDSDEPDVAVGAVQKTSYDIVRDDLGDWLEFVAAERVEAASLERELSRSVSELEDLDLRHVSTMRALYDVRKHRPLWVDVTGTSSGGLNERGDTLMNTLVEAEKVHGLWVEDFHVPTVEALRTGVKTRSEAPFADVRFEAAELRLVEEWAKNHPDASPEKLSRALADRDGPTPRLAEMVGERVDALKATSRTRVRLDLYLTDGLIEYGDQMRWSNPAWYADFQWPDHLKEPETDTRLARDDLRRARRSLLARRELQPVFDDPARLDDTLAGLVPHFEQYQRLTKVLREYVEVVEKGGWPRLPDDVGVLKVGADSESVAVLKERLAAEGYWKGDETTKFTPSLAEALKHYQRTHQLWEKGTLSRETRSSLNVPAERRLAQIRVALQRWRESNVGDDSYYVFVNIPDFHAELWEDGKRKARIQTVVGSTETSRNEETGYMEYSRATPTVSSEISHVVWNPYWWVPDDIVANEIEPEIAQNPWYLEENDYEWASDDQGEAALRQKPGPDNALGQVKLIFENPYQIYMHDTPQKKLFRWPARAFSHGCIRLRKPMELAQALLQRDGQWDQATVDAQLAGGTEKWVTLEEPVPVHIEYYVVRVDDLGRANFLSDLYRKNTRRMTAAMARANERETDAVPAATID